MNCFWASWPQNWKSIQMSSKKDETWLAVIISPTWYVVKFWEDYEKNRYWKHKKDQRGRGWMVTSKIHTEREVNLHKQRNET